MIKLDAYLRDLRFMGRRSSSAEGFYLSPGGVVGVWEGVASRFDDVPRTMAAGSLDTAGYPAARFITLAGWARAATPAMLMHLGRQLVGALSSGDSAQLTLEYAGATLTGMCRLAGPVKFTPMRQDKRKADWQLLLRLPDPYLYGDETLFPAATDVEVYHYGNADAAAVIDVDGDMPSGYEISGPDSRLYTVTRAVVPGTPHRIDMATGLLWENGSIIYGQVSRADTWLIPPGRTVEMSITPVSGYGTIAPRLRDTYL